jgi:hypothetical protein
VAAVIEFEQKHDVVLPLDYVRFVTEFGNGTVKGGSFTIFPLGMTLRDDGCEPLIPFEPTAAVALAQPFSHGLATWPGGDFEDEIKHYVEENGELPPTFNAEVMPGSIPVACEGCGEWCYLAITGPDAGKIWEWANGWMSPVPTPWLRQVTFPEWVVGEVARQRGLLAEFRQLTGVAPRAG